MPKVLLLSLSIGIPVCLFHTFLNKLIFKKDVELDKEANIDFDFLRMGLSGAMCGILISVTIPLKLLTAQMQARDAIWIIVSGFIGAFAFNLKVWVRKTRLAKK